MIYPHDFTTTDGWQLCSVCHKEERNIIHMKRKTEGKSDPLNPSVEVLVHLGSLAVHIDELLSTPAHFKNQTLADQIEGLAASASFDLAAIRQGLNNESVRAWLAEMDKMAFLPKKR